MQEGGKGSECKWCSVHQSTNPDSPLPFECTPYSFLTLPDTQGQVVYGIPIAKSAIPRLGAVARILGAESISLFVDHPDHTKMLEAIPE